MPLQQDQLITLESVLVKEFRLCQALYHLTQEEREALTQGDVLRLMTLAERKETLLDGLTSLANARQRQLAQLSQLDVDKGEDFIVKSLGLLDLDDELQLVSLFEGIRVLKGLVRELALGNQGLATIALKQAASLQAGLVKSTQTSLPALFAAILAARDALDAQDSAAVSLALGELQNALAPGGHSSGDRFYARSVQPSEATAPLEPLDMRFVPASSRDEANMIEYMANLYRQEKAYKAVLQVSSRMLAGA
jgi:flagellar biosynthesis/type III secretory pathway chaperone